MQLDKKALQDDVEEEKAEKETPIHVGYICCCARLQYLFLDCKLLNKSYWHLLLVSLLWQKHYSIMILHVVAYAVNLTKYFVASTTNDISRAYSTNASPEFAV